MARGGDVREGEMISGVWRSRYGEGQWDLWLSGRNSEPMPLFSQARLEAWLDGKIQGGFMGMEPQEVG